MLLSVIHCPVLTSLQTAAVLALTEVRSEDKSELTKLITACKEGYTEKYEENRRHWGGGIMGAKANARIGEWIVPFGLLSVSIDTNLIFSLQPRSKRLWMLPSRSKRSPNGSAGSGY